MKLINIHRPHLQMELDLNLRDWRDAALWLATLGAVAGGVYAKLHK